MEKERKKKISEIQDKSSHEIIQEPIILLHDTFGNFAPYDLHALRPVVCGGFVVKTVAMTFKIPEKKKKTVAKLVVLIS